MFPYFTRWTCLTWLRLDFDPPPRDRRSICSNAHCGSPFPSTLPNFSHAVWAELFSKCNCKCCMILTFAFAFSTYFAYFYFRIYFYNKLQWYKQKLIRMNVGGICYQSRCAVNEALNCNRLLNCFIFIMYCVNVIVKTIVSTAPYLNSIS